ncbi:MFS transporter [Erwinia sp. OLMDLW33]|jgi:MFS family permease|uniref:MFS transporter n=1 Tax=Erwinia aphidicola TaxID=68334 RepID=UPI000C1A144F|nr:MFS transporter [Erwinia sp. OLMDLW33]
MLASELKERLALFDNKTYLYFTLSGLFATLGNGLNYIALSWFAYHQADSIAGVAMMMFFIWMPGIIFAPVFGILADRYSRKTQIVISNLVRGVVVVGWVLLWYLGIKIELMIICALLGIFISFYMPSAVPFIQSIVPKEKLVSANATVDMVYEFGTIVGMGLSGFILSYAGTKGTLLIGGSLFILAGVFNLAMKSPATAHKESEEQESWWQSYVSSLRYFKRHPVLFMPFMNQMIIMTLLMTIPIILVPYTREVLNADTRTFALFEALYSLGVLAGAFLSPVFCRMFTIRNTLALLLAVMACGLVILSVNTNALVVYPVYFLIGFGLSSWALSISLSQLHCAPEYQGRLQATFNGISGCFILAMYLLMAREGASISSQAVYLIQSLLAVAGIAIVLFYKKGKASES